MTIGYGTKPARGPNGRILKPVLGMFQRVEVDDSKRHPEYRRSVHEEACAQAASRVIRKWREALP
jgi:hypothetical protein